MHLLVNTLSIGSMSGEHVVYGFLRPLIARLGKNDRLTILHSKQQPPPADIYSAHQVDGLEISNRSRNWAWRTAWEVLRLPAIVKKYAIDRIWNVSGSITPGLKTRQVSLAMNPWCYVKEAQAGWAQRIKAFMQRRGHRLAFRKAEHMVYISAHLRDLYREANQDCLQDEASSTIAWVGLDDNLFATAQELSQASRKPYSILSVSAFAPWKGVTSVIEALHKLRLGGIPATLDLAGPWPDLAYRSKVEALIEKHGMTEAVTLHGKVEVAELHNLYATRQVYCLMSSSESFGIPAAEAMAFGTPIVSTNCCAIAEVCEGAGLFGPWDDPNWTAQALQEMLTNPATWLRCSIAARDRAGRLGWASCVAPLYPIFGLVAPLESASTAPAHQASAH